MRSTSIAVRSGLLALCVVAGVGRGQFVEDSVWIGWPQVRSLAYNSNHGVVYGASGEGLFFAIDCRELVGCGGGYPQAAYEVAYSVTQDKGYCTYGLDGDESLLVVDGRTHSTIRVVRIPGAGFLLWDPDVNRLYVSCRDFNDVAVLDCANDSIITRIPVGAFPLGMTLNRPHRKLYVQNYDGESVSIIDLNTLLVTRTIPVGNAPVSGCYSEAADRYYCGAAGIYVIDGAGDTVRAFLPLPGTWVTTMLSVEPHSLVMAGGYTGHGDSVFVVDAYRDSIVRALPIGRPNCLTWSSATDLVYCASTSNGNVAAILGDGSRVLTWLAVAQGPSVMIAVPEFHRIFVGHLGSIWMYVIRDTVTGIGEATGLPRPVRSGLAVVPNPFRTSLTLQVDEASGRAGSVRIFSRTGSLVRILPVPTGCSRVVWDGRDDLGKKVSAGVYVLIPSWREGETAKVVKTE
jgi:YVTN family beta-propeller protein